MIAQSAAIPLRIDAAEGVQVLLVTSRRQRRWIIPKGNVAPGRPPHKAAAKEAYEEAGVTGRILQHCVGEYLVEKHDAAGRCVPIIVAAYPLLVREERRAWPEMHQRRRRWVAVAGGLNIVRHLQLRSLIIATARNLPIEPGLQDRAENSER